jgi:hypothetical protein
MRVYACGGKYLSNQMKGEKIMRRYEYSDEIVNVIKRFLADEDWHYSFNEETGIFRFDLRIRRKIQSISYVIDVHEDEFVTYGMCPIGADREDTEMMAQMAEFICRANYGLKNGAFELDFSDGEVRFRSFVDCNDLLPSTKVVRNSVYCTAEIMNCYATGIADIIFGGASAKEAIARCEKTTADELHSALEEAVVGDVSEGAVGELLSRPESELGIGEESSDGNEDEDRPEEIRLNPFAHGSGAGLNQPQSRRNLSAEEGGEA